MDLTGAIQSAEHQFKQILEGYFVSVYEERSLPSHGISHHRRVWNYAKDLLVLQGKGAYESGSRLPDTLIIAAYLHDIGMSVDPGPRHGIHSSELCRKFLHEHDLKETDFPGLLQSILDHDNKEYTNSQGECGLSSILAMADDLDAFGFTGIYRYLEIYILRGVNPEIMGQKIRENAAGRFAHFEKHFFYNETFFGIHRKRYLVLDNFFEGYTREAGKPSGYSKVVEIITNMTKQKEGLNEYLSIAAKDMNEPVVSWFFEGLKSENLF